jgi:hypothetical protein
MKKIVLMFLILSLVSGCDRANTLNARYPVLFEDYPARSVKNFRALPDYLLYEVYV